MGAFFCWHLESPVVGPNDGGGQSSTTLTELRTNTSSALQEGSGGDTKSGSAIGFDPPAII